MRDTRTHQTRSEGVGPRRRARRVSTPAEQNALHELEMAVTREQGSHRAALSGELDLASSQTLVDAVTKLCDEGAKAIVLDIGALEFVDSTGLRAILTATGRVRAQRLRAADRARS